MTYDFRCEKCGKMLKLRKDPGRRCRCPNCRGWTKVPPLLNELPHPNVPPNAERPAGEAVAIDVRQEPEHDHAVALKAVGSTMPWVLSALAHVGVFLIMILFFVIVSRSNPKIDTSQIIEMPPPTNVMGDPWKTSGGAKPRAAERRLIKIKHEPRDTMIAQGSNHRKVVLGEPRDGDGISLEGDGPRDGRGTGLFGIGDGDGDGPRGGAMNVVYVVDRSGSMARTFESVKVEMVRSISRLSEKQWFHVVLFGDGETIEGPRRGLIQAEMDNKKSAGKFLMETEAHGSTTALVALKRAFRVLSARPRHESKVIYLVSDGDFSGMLGGSEYRRPGGGTLKGNEAVLQWLADHNKNAGVCVHTVLLHSADKTALRVLKQIAASNGGRFKYISPDE